MGKEGLGREAFENPALLPFLFIFLPRYKRTDEIGLKSEQDEGSSKSSQKIHINQKLCMDLKNFSQQNKHLLILFFQKPFEVLGT